MKTTDKTNQRIYTLYILTENVSDVLKSNKDIIPIEKVERSSRVEVPKEHSSSNDALHYLYAQKHFTLSDCKRVLLMRDDQVCMHIYDVDEEHKGTKEFFLTSVSSYFVLSPFYEEDKVMRCSKNMYDFLMEFFVANSTKANVDERMKMLGDAMKSKSHIPALQQLDYLKRIVRMDMYFKIEQDSQ